MPRLGACLVWSKIVPSAVRMRIVAPAPAAKSCRFGPAGMNSPCAGLTAVTETRSESLSTAAASLLSKSDRTREAVTLPITIAKPVRMRKVRPAEMRARRQRMGRRSSTEDVAGAADRVEQPRLAAGLELAAQVGDEDLDRVRRGERIVAPDLLEQALARNDDALVAHEVLEQLELALRELDVAVAAAHLVGVRVQREVRD